MQLADLEAELAAARALYSERHPRIASIGNRITELRFGLAAMAGQYSSHTAEILFRVP